ncbi:MAG: inositol monophosphatase family protein [Oligoflexia bacterium]
MKNPQLLQKSMLQAALAAGKVLTRYFEKTFEVREKDQAGLVTNADLEAEAAVIRILRKARPDFGFLAEESGQVQAARAGASDGRWIIDPLDGTTNFVHGFPMFCVSIAAEWQGQIVAGVIHHPILKESTWASLGKGAWVLRGGSRKRVTVSKTQRLKNSLLTTGFTYRKRELHLEMGPFERLSGIARAIRRPGSAALDLAFTARGVFDGFWERNLSPWDVAAGILLIQEAGGKVTDFSGNPFQIEGSEILATNGLIHEDIQNTLQPQSCPI